MLDFVSLVYFKQQAHVVNHNGAVESFCMQNISLHSLRPLIPIAKKQLTETNDNIIWTPILVLKWNIFAAETE